MEQDKRRIKRAQIRICLVCGKKFRATKDQNGKFGGRIRKQIYCSKECWSKRGVTTYKHKCLYCGIWFETKDKRIKKYCSRECAFKDKIGAKAGAYKDGKSLLREKARYGNKLKKWREAIFKRDNYTCQQCGSKGCMHAHHIQGWAENKLTRFNINNGITLCEICHGKIHNKDFSNRRNKRCYVCGKFITGKGKTGLCRSCSIKQWHKYTKQKAEKLNA